MGESESIYRVDDSGILHAYTTKPAIANRLIRKGATPPRIEKINGKPAGWFFVLPGWYCIPRKRRTIPKPHAGGDSEAQKEAKEAKGAIE